MQPEHLAVALRPRGGWEALDLGFQMARQWWRPIWLAWLTVYLPLAAVLLVAFENKWWTVLILLWLKPLFDRAVLHTVSRAVFGEVSGPLKTLRAARDWLHPGLFLALTFFRFNTARSFTLPVAQLEKQTGRAARLRRAALGGRMRGYAVWLWLVCVHLEGVCAYALAALASMLEPAAGQFIPAPEEVPSGLSLWESIRVLGWQDALYYIVAVSLIEPFYVSAGFALYLARRAMLEGWDIEIALRRMEDRLRASARGKGAGLAAAMLLTLFLSGGPPEQAHAAVEAPAATAGSCPAPAGWLAETYPASPARQALEAVFATPEFSEHKDITRWHYLGRSEPKKDPGDGAALLAWLENLSLLFGDIGQVLAWIAMGILLVLALAYVRRLAPIFLDRRGPAYLPPQTLFGLQVAPASLPANIAAAAGALAEQGRVREALSLLYRGALSALIHRHQIAMSAADTEGDCLRAAQRALPSDASAFFATLVQTWKAVAYAGRAPELPAVTALCKQWPAHFQGPAS